MAASSIVALVLSIVALILALMSVYFAWATGQVLSGKWDIPPDDDDQEAHIVILRKHRDEHDKAVVDMQAQHDEISRELERKRQQPQPDSE